MKTEQTGNNSCKANRNRLLLRLTALLAINLLPLCYGGDRGPIEPGETKAGIQISGFPYRDTWTFSGNAGDRVIINAVTTSGNLNTMIVLYPPGGANREVDSNSGDQLEWQLQTNGLYTILIEDWDLSKTGTYYISLAKIPNTLRPGLYNPRPAVGLTINNSLYLLQWDPVAGATGYDLYFGQNVTAPLVKVGTNFAGASFPLPPVQSGKTYVWHVVAHTPAGLVDGPYWWFAVGVPSIRLTAPVLLPDRRCQVGLRGTSVEPVRIQASTNLTEWTTLTTLPNLQGNFDYIDSEAASYPSRFYRAVSP